jgi:hypothetical protein
LSTHYPFSFLSLSVQQKTVIETLIDRLQNDVVKSEKLPWSWLCALVLRVFGGSLVPDRAGYGKGVTAPILHSILENSWQEQRDNWSDKICKSEPHRSLSFLSPHSTLKKPPLCIVDLISTSKIFENQRVPPHQIMDFVVESISDTGSTPPVMLLSNESSTQPIEALIPRRLATVMERTSDNSGGSGGYTRLRKGTLLRFRCSNVVVSRSHNLRLLPSDNVVILVPPNDAAAIDAKISQSNVASPVVSPTLSRIAKSPTSTTLPHFAVDELFKQLPPSGALGVDVITLHWAVKRCTVIDIDPVRRRNAGDDQFHHCYQLVRLQCPSSALLYVLLFWDEQVKMTALFEIGDSIVLERPCISSLTQIALNEIDCVLEYGPMSVLSVTPQTLALAEVGGDTEGEKRKVS